MAEKYGFTRLHVLGNCDHAALIASYVAKIIHASGSISNVDCLNAPMKLEVRGLML